MNLKTTLLSIAFLTIANILFSQNIQNVYSKMYDNMSEMVTTIYLTENANDYDSYGDGISYYLESTLIMFELTNDKKYLDEFISVSNEVISNRDDYRQVNQNNPLWSTYSRGDKSAAAYGGISYHTALILKSMAHYIYFSKSQFNSTFNSPLQNSFVTFDGFVPSNYNDYATWLYTKIKITLDYYSLHYWIPNLGYRQYANDSYFATSVGADGLDRNCNWGAVNTYLAIAYYGTLEGFNYYDKVQTLASRLKTCFTEATDANGNTFLQWNNIGWSNLSSTVPDDISHAGAVIDFAYLLNQFKNVIKSSPGGCCVNGYMSDNEMNKLANTLIHRVYDSPLKYHNAVDGSCNFYKWPNCHNGDYLMPYSMSRWLLLAKVIDPTKYTSLNISYHMASDFYSTFLENPYLTYSRSEPNCDWDTVCYSATKVRYGGSIGATALGLSLAAKNQGLFKFLGRNSLPGGSSDNDWQGVASGDFNNDGQPNEVVAIRNSDGGIYFSDILPNNTLYSEQNTIVNFNNVGYRFSSKGSVITGGQNTGVSNSNWKGITVGHFVSDIPGDQIAAIRESDGALFVWKPIFNQLSNSYTLQTILMNNSSGTGNYWVGLTSGDFDGDGNDEISAVRNVNGEFFIWKVKKTGSTYYFSTMLSNNSSGTGNDWASITSGDFNNDGKDELCAVRNSDGGFWIWQVVNNGGVFSFSNYVFNNSSGAGNQWNNIVVGDFNSDGKKDLLAHRNIDGAFFLYNVSGSTLITKAVEYLPVNQDLGVICVGKLPNNTKEAIVSLRNSDGDYMLYQLDFGLKVSKSEDQSNTEYYENDLNNSFQDILVLPNPSSEVIVLASLSDDTNQKNINIYSVEGQLVKTIQNYIFGDKINIGELSTGLYTIVVNSKGGETSVVRLCKE